MTGFEHMLTDEEIAAVMFYVREELAWVKGRPARLIDPKEVARVREEVKDKQGFYMVEEILKEHPMTGDF